MPSCICLEHQALVDSTIKTQGVSVTKRIGSLMKLRRLIPMQPVQSMPSAVVFYEKLGFVVEDRNDEWGWAMLRCGDCQLMLDQSINCHPGIPRISVLYLYPESVQAFYRNAQANGLVVPEPVVTFYEMTEFRMEDPDGNRLWVGQPKG